MPNFKKDKSNFQMKNTQFYKDRFAEGEANSPYNKNGGGHEAIHNAISAYGKNWAELATERIAKNQMSKYKANLVKGEGKMSKLTSKIHKSYVPQSISRKDPSTDIMPQSIDPSKRKMAILQKGPKKLKHMERR